MKITRNLVPLVLLLAPSAFTATIYDSLGPAPVDSAPIAQTVNSYTSPATINYMVNSYSSPKSSLYATYSGGSQASSPGMVLTPTIPAPVMYAPPPTQTSQPAPIDLQVTTSALGLPTSNSLGTTSSISSVTPNTSYSYYSSNYNTSAQYVGYSGRDMSAYYGAPAPAPPIIQPPPPPVIQLPNTNSQLPPITFPNEQLIENPEPSSFVLLGLGMAGLMWAQRKRR